MLKNHPKPTSAQLAEIERLEADARLCLEKAEESFQRSDTDGFLSQWAMGITAQKNQRQIEVLKHGGYARFAVLCDADGNVLADHEYRFENQYTGGTDRKWKLDSEAETRYGRRWIPAGSNSRIQKQLGLHEEDRWFPARAALMGSGTGLSGCASAYVGVERVYA